MTEAELFALAIIVQSKISGMNARNQLDDKAANYPFFDYSDFVIAAECLETELIKREKL